MPLSPTTTTVGNVTVMTPLSTCTSAATKGCDSGTGIKSPTTLSSKSKKTGTVTPRGSTSKSCVGTNSARKLTPSKNKAVKDTTRLKSVEEIFEDHAAFEKRVQKTLCYAGRLPSTSRPSFPLTILAVNAFTSGNLGMELDTLDFLDMDLASEIGRNACVSPTVVIMALVYLDRLSKHNPKYLSSVKPSELFVVALLVASKFEQEDGEQYGIYNSDWVEHAPFDRKRLNQLEINFLSGLDWNVKVDLGEYLAMLTNVETAISSAQTKNRDWMTYTEITCISDAFLSWESLWPILYTYVIQVVTIACISYVTLLATFMTSYTITPELMRFTHTFLTTVSDSLTPESPIVFPKTRIQMEPTSTHFENVSKLCHQLNIESLLQEHAQWDTAYGSSEITTSGQRRTIISTTENTTAYEYVGTIQALLSHFRPNLNPGRAAVDERQNYLHTISKPHIQNLG